MRCNGCERRRFKPLTTAGNSNQRIKQRASDLGQHGRVHVDIGVDEHNEFRFRKLVQKVFCRFSNRAAFEAAR